MIRWVSDVFHFGYIQQSGSFAQKKKKEKKKKSLGHRFGAAMKVNENRHLGSSAFDPPCIEILHFFTRSLAVTRAGP